LRQDLPAEKGEWPEAEREPAPLFETLRRKRLPHGAQRGHVRAHLGRAAAGLQDLVHPRLEPLHKRGAQRIERVAQLPQAIDGDDQVSAGPKHPRHLVEGLVEARQPRQHAERDEERKPLVGKRQRMNVADLNRNLRAAIGGAAACGANHGLDRVERVDRKTPARQGNSCVSGAAAGVENARLRRQGKLIDHGERGAQPFLVNGFLDAVALVDPFPIGGLVAKIGVERVLGIGRDVTDVAVPVVLRIEFGRSVQHGADCLFAARTQTTAPALFSLFDA
jgi:hypothetical protein